MGSQLAVSRPRVRPSAHKRIQVAKQNAEGTRRSEPVGQKIATVGVFFVRMFIFRSGRDGLQCAFVAFSPSPFSKRGRKATASSPTDATQFPSFIIFSAAERKSSV